MWLKKSLKSNQILNNYVIDIGSSSDEIRFKELDLSEKRNRRSKILRELKQNGSPEPEFDINEERTYLNMIIRIRDGFEKEEKMSESMSELERARMQIILIHLETNKKINSSVAAKLLEVEIKIVSHLLLEAEKLDILKGAEKQRIKYILENNANKCHKDTISRLINKCCRVQTEEILWVIFQLIDFYLRMMHHLQKD